MYVAPHLVPRRRDGLGSTLREKMVQSFGISTATSPLATSPLYQQWLARKQPAATEPVALTPAINIKSWGGWSQPTTPASTAVAPVPTAPTTMVPRPQPLTVVPQSGGLPPAEVFVAEEEGAAPTGSLPVGALAIGGLLLLLLARR